MADALLLLVTFVWGSTFVMVKKAVTDTPVYLFLTMRFALAALALGIVSSRRLRPMSWRQVVPGVLVGVTLFAGYAFQTAGLRFTASAKAGFITGLSVVIVPILSATLLRRWPTKQAVLGVVLSATGLGLLSLDRNFRIGDGDALVLCGAVSFALHIIAVGAFASKSDPLWLATIQVTTVAVLSAIFAAASGELQPLRASLSPQTWFAAAFTGVFATAIAFAIQNSAQRHTSPTHTALVFAAEPVFAGLFGVLVAGEQLSRRMVAGGFLIVAGMICGEIEVRGKIAGWVSRIPMVLLTGVGKRGGTENTLWRRKS